MSVHEPELLYEPSPGMYHGARVWDYIRWLGEHRGVDLAGWDELYVWSVEHLEEFWASLWDYFAIIAHAPYDRVLVERTMPGARWFPGALVNYAEHALRHAQSRPDDSAVVAYSQTRDEIELTFAELAEEVRRVRAGLRRLGVGRGDRVAAYLPNIPETLIAYLATASLGAIWSSCAPEFGPRSVVDRFGQIEPTVLLAVAGYTFGEKRIDKRADVAAVRAGLPTVEHLVEVPYGSYDRLGLDDTVAWAELGAETDETLAFEPVPFDHPLCILYSSGTTGLPKAIVHSHGGLMLEHLKCQTFHWDLGPGDRLLWFSTTAWMLWNALVSGLVTGASIVLTDGNPLYPDLRAQWRLAERSGAAKMGANPAFLMACRKAGVRPEEEFDLSRLRQIGVAGSPLPPEGARWVAEQFGNRVLLNNGVGGTDICTGLVHGSPLQPVWAGEMSGPTLGADVKAYDAEGRPVTDQLGELVIRTPLPSMPVAFWGDRDGRRLREAYFSRYPGVFRFGDWCRFSKVGSCLVTGRSDATLNRGGVRLGTAEYYRVLQDLPGVADSVVVHLEDPAGGPGQLLLFVVPAEGTHVDDALRSRIVAAVRGSLSPRHVPDRIIEVPAVPYSRTGKKLEIPVKQILRGAEPSTVASPGALVDPSALDAYVALAHSLGEDS